MFQLKCKLEFSVIDSDNDASVEDDLNFNQNYPQISLVRVDLKYIVETC